jgi:hypothetical protein
MAQDITEKEAEELIRSFSEGKQNAHSFLTNIVKAPDTTKTGNLEEEELGMPKVPVRTFKELGLFSKDVLDQEEWADYFNKMSEIQTSTSLSKKGLLVRLAVTLKKELADMTPTKKTNKGWFKPKGDSQQEQQV